MRELAGAIVLAALILAAAIIFTRPEAPRYQLASIGDRPYRLDTQSGEIVICSVQGGCVTVAPSEDIWADAERAGNTAEARATN